MVPFNSFSQWQRRESKRGAVGSGHQSTDRETTPMTQQAVTTTRADEFHERIHANHMYGLWELASQMTPHPKPKAIPYMWSSDLIKSVVAESGTAVPVGEERRAMQLFN